MSVAEIPSSVLVQDGLLWSLDALRLLALPLLIVLPGLALGRWLLPARAAPWTRLTWGLGAGIGCYIFGRVLFHALGVGESPVWVGVLLLLSLAALLRSPTRGQRPVRDRAQARDRRTQAVLLVLAVAITAGAVALSRTGSVRASQKSYTEFWAVPDPQGLLVGIRNREGEAAGYRIEVRQNWELRAQWEVPPVASGATVERRFLPRPALAGTDLDPWQILLYRAGQPQVYRHVTFQR